jgi:hypothetical protein
MPKDKLIEIIQGILETDVDMRFLLQLNKIDLETLIACIRERVNQGIYLTISYLHGFFTKARNVNS